MRYLSLLVKGSQFCAILAATERGFKSEFCYERDGATRLSVRGDYDTLALTRWYQNSCNIRGKNIPPGTLISYSCS